MASTKETYDYLVESHGIKTDVCKYCYNRDVEVFQDNWVFAGAMNVNLK